MKLYDYLRHKPAYHEGRLKKDFADSPLLKHFSVAKNYLYNVLLQFLCSPGGEDKEKELLGSMMAAKKLMDKCLYHHALRIVRKAKKKAISQEKFKFLLELLELEKANCLQIADGKALSKQVQEIIKEEKLVFKQLNQLMHLQHLYDRLRILKGDQGVDFRQEKVIGEGPSWIDEKSVQSIRGRVLIGRIHAQLALRESDFNTLVVQLQLCQDLMEGHPDILADRAMFHVYLETLFNLGQAHLVLGDFISARRLTQKLDRIESDDDGKVRLAERRMVMQISVAIMENDWKSGKKIVERINSDLQAYKGRLHQGKELMLYYVTAHYLITMGRFSEANLWLQAIQQGHFADYRMDYQCYAELLFLVVQLELGNRDVIAYYATNIRNRLYRKKRLGQVEKAILRFFRLIANSKDKAGDKQLFSTYAEELAVLYQSPQHAQSKHYFDFEDWLESLLQNKSMSQLRRG